MSQPADYVTRVFDIILTNITNSLLVAIITEKVVDEEGGLWKAVINTGLSGEVVIEIHRTSKGWRLYVNSNQNPKQYELADIDDVERMFWNPQLLMV